MAQIPSPGSAELFSLAGRAAIVTGASSGLGARFVRVLAGAGAQVVATARREDRLMALAAETDNVLPVACDVSAPADLEALIAFALREFGRLDVLVNNAGISNPKPAEDEPLAEFRQVLDVNVSALFRLSQLAALAMFGSAGGSIVNVASMFGLVGAAPLQQASYTASKGAVVNLTRQLGGEWARRGVRVNALAPGFFPSEMSEGMLGEERSRAYIRRNTPVGRPGLAHELDGALLFLVSDASTYVTGQTLAVDGGWTAR